LFLLELALVQPKNTLRHGGSVQPEMPMQMPVMASIQVRISALQEGFSKNLTPLPAPS
jgi:hypothetical protein